MVYDKLQEVYDFMNGRDISSSYTDPAHKSQIDFSTFEKAYEEGLDVKKIIRELILEKASISKTDLIASVESELDVTKILESYMKEVGFSTYAEFKDYFTKTNDAI